MRFNSNIMNVQGPQTATVELQSGDSVSVVYTAPDGNKNVFVISAQHLVLLAVHEASESALVCRPGKSVQYVTGSK